MSDNQSTNVLSSYEKAMDEARHFLDVPMKVTIQLSSRNMKVREILQLQTGSIVDLPKSAGENVDVLVNDRTVAFGEVIELEGSVGIRLTDLNRLG
jgi:flagellar motor switch protein FliN/FliY